MAGAAGRGGPYRRRGGEGWLTSDRARYLVVFAKEFGIRPWEIEKLDVEDFETLIDYAEEHLIRRDG